MFGLAAVAASRRLCREPRSDTQILSQIFPNLPISDHKSKTFPVQNCPNRYILLQTGDDIPRYCIVPPLAGSGCPTVGVTGMGAAIRVIIAQTLRKREWRRREHAVDRADATAAVPHCRGFSLLELLMVLAVTVLLTGLLMPAMAHVRENARRIVCQSNLRQLGMAVVIYTDEKNTMPFSFYGQPGESKRHMMAAHLGAVMFGVDRNGGYNQPMAIENWEGLGWLQGGRFVNSPEVFYCPSHYGEHPYERYQDIFHRYRDFDAAAAEPIYTNYQYAGDIDWANESQPNRRRRLTDENLVIATDGLRTLSDFNHLVGMNVLRGDSSVAWQQDITTNQVRNMLPTTPSPGCRL